MDYIVEELSTSLLLVEYLFFRCSAAETLATVPKSAAHLK